MKSEDLKVTVKYKTRRDTCNCCGQDLIKHEISNGREFDFYLKDIKQYENWNLVEDEEMEDVLDEFIHNTISFYATNNDDMVILLDGEIEKFLSFIKDNIINE